MKLTLFDTLLELPLFQGLGKDALNDIALRAKLDFAKIQPNAVIALQDTTCNQLIFTLSGDMTAQMTSNDHSYILRELFQQQNIIQPESLFGLYPRYTRSYIAKTTTSLLRIEKKAIVEQFFMYDVFRFNLLNLLSTHIQQSQRLLRKKQPSTIQGRFIHFVQARSIKPAGEKTLQIRMNDLADQLGETRLNVSRMLHEMCEQGLLEFERKQIFIPAFENLLQHYNMK